MRQRLLIMLMVCLPTLGSDLWTKSWAKKHLIEEGQLSYFGDLFRLEYAINPGSWGGFLGQLPEKARALALVYGVGLFLLGVMIYTLRNAHSKQETLALSLVLSGGLGNLIDRAMQGYVVDFLNVGLGTGLRTNIFNIADMLILTGIGLFFVTQLRAEPTPKVGSEEAIKN